MTFLPANSAAGSTSAPPSGVACLMVTDGIFWPAAIMAIALPQSHRARAGTRARNAGAVARAARHRRRPSRSRCTGRAGPARASMRRRRRDRAARDAVDDATRRAPIERAPVLAVVDEHGVERRDRRARRRRSGTATGTAQRSRACAAGEARIAREVAPRGDLGLARASRATSAGIAASKRRGVVGVERRERRRRSSRSHACRRARSSRDAVAVPPRRRRRRSSQAGREIVGRAAACAHARARQPAIASAISARHGALGHPRARRATSRQREVRRAA